MALSQEFENQIKELMPAEAEQLLHAIEHTSPSVSVRVNPRKGGELSADAKRVPWCGDGAYLAERPQFTFDTDFQSGRYYVQDASSMFIAHAIKQLVAEPVRYLDLCAAPGGKTTAAIASLPAGSLVVANEIVPLRAKILKENVVKWGYSNAVVTHNRPADFSPLTHFFDVIATDVPCSGEGMMRKDDEAVEQWTPALVEECAARQKSIIDDIWNCLRPGGLLIYSTCTYNRAENEDMVRYICENYGATTIDLNADEQWNIYRSLDEGLHCYRFMPHRTDGEGLFLSAIRKPDDEPRDEYRPKKKKAGKEAKPQPVPADAKIWLVDAGAYQYNVVGDAVTAVPKAHAEEVATLSSVVYVTHSGVELGTIKGKNCVPSQSLALSIELNRSAFEQVEVDYATAIAYLRGEAVVIDAPRGYVLLTHRGAVLGFVNNLGNRANNLYPKEWRIRSTHAPAEKPSVL